jgi:hypothetical protein
MSEHTEKLRRALAQLQDELTVFNDCEEALSEAGEDPGGASDKEVWARDDTAVEVARSAAALLPLLTEHFAALKAQAEQWEKDAKDMAVAEPDDMETVENDTIAIISAEAAAFLRSVLPPKDES